MAWLSRTHGLTQDSDRDVSNFRKEGPSEILSAGQDGDKSA